VKCCKCFIRKTTIKNKVTRQCMRYTV
jgi:hypothetical protein